MGLRLTALTLGVFMSSPETLDATMGLSIRAELQHGTEDEYPVPTIEWGPVDKHTIMHRKQLRCILEDLYRSDRRGTAF